MVTFGFPSLDNYKRNIIATIYDEIACKGFDIPKRNPKSSHVFHLYVCKTERRDKMMEFLTESGINAGIHYRLPVHLQRAYRNKIKHSGTLSQTESISSKIISLPMYP